MATDTQAPVRPELAEFTELLREILLKNFTREEREQMAAEAAETSKGQAATYCLSPLPERETNVTTTIVPQTAARIAALESALARLQEKYTDMDRDLTRAEDRITALEAQVDRNRTAARNAREFDRMVQARAEGW